MANLIRSALTLVLVSAIAGCASTGKIGAQKEFDDSIASDKKSTPVLSPKRNVSQELVRQGVIYLREGNYENAQKVFSAAIKVNPNNSTIHLLNGISYHLEFINGSPDSKALAETAYGLANTLDKSDPLPLIQLGRLHMSSGSYARAGKEFIAAHAVSPNDQDALAGVLQTSLLQKDFKTALWAGDKIKALKISSADNQRLLVLMYAAAGRPEEAQMHLDAYAKSKSKDPNSVESLKRQLIYIETQRLNFMQSPNDFYKGKLESTNGELIVSSKAPQMIKAANNDNDNRNVGNSGPGNAGRGINSGKNGSGARGGVNAAGVASAISTEKQNNDDDSSSGSTSSSAPAAPSTSNATAPAISAGGGSGTYSAVSMSPQQARWFDCDTRPGLGKAPGGGYGVPVGGTSGDQTLYLEPLPSPCANHTPKMASFDAVLIRTTDVQGTSHGINLLTGLQIFAGSQRSSSTATTGNTSVTTDYNTNVIGFGVASAATVGANSISGILNYTLNIANSVTANTQVVARPTLTALDRIPSTFYSGGVQTVGLNGGGVSGAQVTNIPTGISLSVTPTFVDEDTMMLAVKVSRSFINGTAPIGNFSAGISVAQHAVTSNIRIKYGETLILDGLTLRSFTSQQDGVPILQDIPIIQYLFNQKQRQQYSENVLVMITPRKIISNANDLQKIEDELAKKRDQLTPQEKNVYQSIQSYQDLVKNLYPSLNGALAAMDRDSSYFRNFKRAVISNDNDAWVSQSSMSRFLNDAADMLYFTR